MVTIQDVEISAGSKTYTSLGVQREHGFTSGIRRKKPKRIYLGLNESLQSSVENQKMLIDLNVYCLKTSLLLVAYKALPIALPCDLHSSCSPPHTQGTSHPGPAAIPYTCYSCFYFRVLDLTVLCMLKDSSARFL